MPLFAILRKTSDFWKPLMGFMDRQGNVKIEPQFLNTVLYQRKVFSDAGYTVVQRPGAKQPIVIDEGGETVFEFPKDHQPINFAAPDAHGIFGVVHEVDAGNQELWKLDGREFYFLGETRYYAMRIDGSIAFEAYISKAMNGFYVFSKSPKATEKRGLMNHEGQVIIPPIYDRISLSQTDPYVTVVKDGAANILTYEGSPVFPRSFQIDDPFFLPTVEDGLWIVAKSDQSHADVYDVASTAVIGQLPMTFSSPTLPIVIPRLSGGVVRINDACKGSMYLYPDGRPVMPGVSGRPRWFKPEMQTGDFHDGRASFRLGKVSGYLDLSGEAAIAAQFNSDHPFQHGLARVRYPADGNSLDRYSYIDREGNVVWHQEY
ncbi:WG repeat-containing protein [Pararhodobacter zhoushanensis]|uniref:WG repeat-containing protein n=1 Tax=Pararhodobacter zhoushanensis TaxID=2479545 RepID=A0ABT3H2D0_9RHOB|nr:WG repeat-containing protein [Pararhodobacter zhoushanensis]MCW1404413.1 WG repeat-containing protein [Novosphingobium sp. MW5]MCW1934001.1 WG repeat-containing protein [Pararhodobacter zhoushanensis]